MALILPSRSARITQPAGPTEVDFTHPFAKYAVAVWGGYQRKNDALGNAMGWIDSAVTQRVGADGVEQYLDTTTAPGLGYWVDKRIGVLGTDDFFMQLRVNPSLLTAVPVFFGKGDIGAAEWMFGAASTTGLRLYGAGGAIASSSPPGRLVGGVLQTVAASRVGGVAYVYLNGVRIGTDTTAGSNLSDLTHHLTIGSGDYDGTTFDNARNHRGGHSQAILLRGIGGDAVAEEMSRNPWQLFKPQSRSIIIDMGAGGGPVGGNASATPAPLTTTPATGTATGAASTTATPAPVSATPAQATATGGAAAQATPAPLTTTAAQATATGAAQAAATPAPVQVIPATGTATGAAGGEVVASATPAPLSIAAPTGTATGGAAAQATPAPITTTAPTASVGSGANASATLAALGLMPATGAATGGAVATALPAQIIITPATGSATGGAQAYATPAQITITPATGIGSDGTYAPITWPTGAAASRAAIVPPFYGLAIVGPVNPAIVPVHGDDMQPIKTFELHLDDREIYEVDFGRLYLSTARDSAATLEAISAPAGLTVTPEVPVGGALTSGVVRFAAAQTGGPGSYDVAARISTAAGRRKTGVVTIVVAP